MPKKRDLETEIARYVKEKHPNETGIIYCNARARTEDVAKRLSDQGLKARHFHAGLCDGDKKRIQQQWQNNECNIIVATIAFGMGVDKADGKRHQSENLCRSANLPNSALRYTL